jgi:Na+-driven multidrug efflux pump
LEQKSLRAKKLFTNGNLFKLFIPLIIEQFLEYLVGLADSIMVSSVGESAVSGVSLVDFVMALLISLFAALATGGAVIAGQYMGKKQMKESREAANQLVWFAGVFSVIIMVIIYLIKPLILNGLFGTITDEVRNDANTYLMIVSISIPFLALYNVGAAIFRTMGNAKLPMKIMIAMNIAHAIGNAVLIYGFHFGTEGVAIPPSIILLNLIFGVIADLIMTEVKPIDDLNLHIEEIGSFSFRALCKSFLISKIKISLDLITFSKSKSMLERFFVLNIRKPIVLKLFLNSTQSLINVLDT